MRQKISLPIEPYSINAVYYNNRSIKRPEALQWGYRVMHLMSDDKIASKLEKLRKHFDPSKHQYHVHLVFKYPKNLLYKADGSLSARAHDLSNIEKLLVDHLFLPVYFNKETPYGCKNLNVDDKYITKLVSEKTASHDEVHAIDITIRIRPL